MNTNLSIEVSECNSLKTMRLYDTSHYFSNEKIENYLLEILPVNSSKWILFNVNKHFNLILNSSNLQYKKVSDNSQLIDLPDGIYEIKQSYKPNSYTLNHFLHFRTQSLSKDIQEAKVKLFDKKCELDKKEFISNLNKLRDIEDYMKAGKWMVEECLEKKQGKEMYEFAQKLLEQYTNECKCR